MIKTKREGTEMKSDEKLNKILLKIFGGEAGWAWRLQKPGCPHLISSMNGTRTACQIQIDHRKEGDKCTCYPGNCPVIQQAIDEVEKEDDHEGGKE
jgi:hypothetical protein